MVLASYVWKHAYARVHVAMSPKNIGVAQGWG